MSDFAVVTSAVQHVSSMAHAARAELGAELTRLRREAENVLAGQWRGRTATAFDRNWNTWDAGAREVVTALDRLAEALAASGRDYAVRDEVNASSLRIAL